MQHSCLRGPRGRPGGDVGAAADPRALLVALEQAGIEVIYRQHAPAVLRFALGLCGDRGGAEDLVTETFVRLLTSLPG